MNSSFQENNDIDDFIERFSQQDHSQFCLAYALTYTEFKGLGLAYMGNILLKSMS